MKLLLLGTTGYHPNDRRETACFMLPELGIVLDAGTGMYRVRDHLATDHLDIFLTHAHLDHIFGITFLFDILHGKQLDYVHVHGEAAKLDAIAQHMFAEPLFPVKPPFEYRPLKRETKLPNKGKLTHFPLVHPGGSIGYRLDWPEASLAYVTDTTADPNAAYVEKIRNVDVLIHECYFPDGEEEMAKITGHSCITPVAEVAAAADVGLLLLVHVNPLLLDDDPFNLKAARKIFPAIEIGEDLTSIEF